MIRKPAVAGQFYEDNPRTLRVDVERHLDRSAEKEDVTACVCPHAGYMFSGDVAGAVLSSVNVPKTVIVASFSHRGLGRPFAVWPDGAWETPLGAVSVNAGLAAKLVDASDRLEADTDAFRFEHSGEVMLPFLQVLRADVDVVMMSIYPAAHLKDLLEIGHDMASVLRDTDPRPLLLASTDMTHHMHASAAEKQDRLVIDRMVELDAEGMYEVVAEHDISMCGVCPVTVVITCARELGATTGRLVRYENSAKATGDRSSVVAYAGLVFK